MGRHKGSIAWNKGIPFSEEAKHNMSLAHKGQHSSSKTEFRKGMIPWNKGLTKDTDSRVAKSAITNSKSQTGKIRSEAQKAKIKKWCLEHIEILSRAGKAALMKNWEKPTQIEIKLSELLEEILPNNYKYIGDGQVWIARGNPDFININGKKKLIEVFHPYFKIKNHGSVEEYKRIRYAKFAPYGFTTLFISGEELKDKDNLVKKILEFNGK